MQKKSWYLRIIFLGLIGSTLIIGYNLHSSPQRQLAGIFVNGSNCVAPCWYGLTPGISTLADINKLYHKNQSSFLFPEQINYSNTDLLISEIYDYKWRWTDLDNGLHTSIYLVENEIISISFGTRKVTMADVLNKLGSPDYYDAYQDGIDSGIWAMDLIYQSKGIVIHSEVRSFGPRGGPCNQPIEPEWLVEDIVLVEPNMESPQIMYATSFGQGVGLWTDSIREWNGVINFTRHCEP